jgi:hypothetical protein
MSCKICEKMLHTLFKAESSSDSLLFANSTYQRLSAFFFPVPLSTAELIWTRVIGNGLNSSERDDIQTMDRQVFRVVVLRRNGTENRVKQMAHFVPNRCRSIPPVWACNTSVRLFPFRELAPI